MDMWIRDKHPYGLIKKRGKFKILNILSELSELKNYSITLFLPQQTYQQLFGKKKMDLLPKEQF